MPGLNGLTYDASNRLTSVTGVGDQYSYAPDNRRVYKNGQIFFYGADGNLLGVYTIQVTTSIAFTAVQTYQYFGGREISRLEDRLKSVMTGSRYYPYGEESPATANDKQKFATYWREASTTLDYAHHRYYQSTLGRFLASDPLDKSARVTDPRSWHRYSYSHGDPSNLSDPTGLVVPLCGPEEEDCVPWDPDHPAPDDPPPFDPPSPPPPDCRGKMANLLRNYLTQQHSPLAVNAGDFVRIGAATDVDPAVLVAIAGAETTFGLGSTNHPYDRTSNNPFGLGPGNRYTSITAAIQAAANTINSQINRGNDSIALLYSGQRGAYCVGPGCSVGERNATAFLVALGGDPGGDGRKRALRFKCDEE